MNAVSNLDIIKGIRDLPSLPDVVYDLLGSFDQPDINLSVLAERVARDQALAAKTLRLANSSFYGLSCKVTTIQQAITVLGFDTVRTLVSAAGIAANFPRTNDASFSFKDFWRHSIGTAYCAKLLARTLSLSENQAFICGLLHDIGRLVLVTQFSSEYQAVLAYKKSHDSMLLEAERAVLDTDHMAVGRLLAEHWKFPPIMQRTISTHHFPQSIDVKNIPGVVHVADAIVHGLDLSGSEDDHVPSLNAASWNYIEKQIPDLEEILRFVETSFEEVCRGMDV